MKLLEYIKIETWLTHPEYFYQVTVEDYEIERFVKAKKQII